MAKSANRRDIATVFWKRCVILMRPMSRVRRPVSPLPEKVSTMFRSRLRNHSGSYSAKRPNPWFQAGSSFCLAVLLSVLLLPEFAAAQYGSNIRPVPASYLQPAVVPMPQDTSKADRLITEVLEPELVMELDPRRSKIIRTTKPVARISITDPEVAEVVEFGPMEFELIGGKTGQTSLTLWFGQDEQNRELLRYVVKVSPDEAMEDRLVIEYGDLQRKINELFPGSVVQLIPVADKLIVKGQARDGKDAAEIMSVIRGQAASGSGGGTYTWLGPTEGAAAQPQDS